METQDLKEYLGMVVDMEASCEPLKRLRENLRQQLVSIQNPQPETLTPPIRPVKPDKLEQADAFRTTCTSLLGSLAIIIMTIASVVLVVGTVPLLFYLLVSFLSGSIEPFVENFRFWAKIGVSIGVPIGIILSFKAVGEEIELNRKKNEELYNYNRACQDYQQAIKDYPIAVKKERQRIENDMQRANNKRAYLRKLLADVDNKVYESFQCLQELYSYNIIHPKFRDFISVCSLYEYIDTGMCSTLEGDYGAYRLLEQAKMSQQIIISLDMVIQEPNAIRENQYELFMRLQANQRTLDHISASICSILANLNVDSKESSTTQSNEASAYFEERRQKEQNYRNRMDSLL